METAQASSDANPLPLDAKPAHRTRINRIPTSTYRIQLREDFGFVALANLVEYMKSLGISDFYLSPLFQSRSESVHGYDVVDHAKIEPSFGSEDEFRRMANAARANGIGILLDLVPNHMGINDPANRLWNDVLENGPAARSAEWFDIEWNPEGGGLRNQVLLPFLGKPFGECLEGGELSLVMENGRFAVAYYESRFPVSPTTWTSIIDLAVKHLDPSTPDEARMELKSIATQLRRLPPPEQNDLEATEERYREQNIAQKRLSALLADSDCVRAAVQQAIDDFNGTPNDPRSWDRLESLLSRQHYRLAFWQVAADEINYRRFFDINDLAAIRVENRNVYEAVHKLTFELISEGLVTGVRIDHPDGLLGPIEYFRDLQANYRRVVGLIPAATQSNPDFGTDSHLYIVAEKILSGEEKMPEDWPISGTTGYDFLNDLNALLVDSAGVEQIHAFYPNLADNDQSPRDTIYHGKLTILHDSMSSELAMIASRLFSLSKESRLSRDFTFPALRRALREVIACFSVYRTYVQSYGWEVAAEDHRRVMDAIRWAKRRNRTMNWAILDYIASILLLEFPAQLPEELKPQWRRFAVRFQQITGPITAKGVEDTAFYRYFPLASLNEVGAELGTTGLTDERFHLKMHARATDWPHALSATGTHDMKRGEDVRARLNVLSEIPSSWQNTVQDCEKACEPIFQEIDGDLAPSKNERYLIYQTLIGTWPTDTTNADQWDEYRLRIKAYCLKFIREAKQHSSWTNPSASYESAIEGFLDLYLENRDSALLRPIEKIAQEIVGPGFANGITQVVLKSTLPGVPDFYQGSEFWDFRLVDPDNRQPVDFELRMKLLKQVQSEFENDPVSLARRLSESWDNQLKMFVTWRTLTARSRHKELFNFGEYLPLSFDGPLEKHLFGFARRLDNHWAIIITPRHTKQLTQATGKAISEKTLPNHLMGSTWNECRVKLPDGAPDKWYDELLSSPHIAHDQSLAIDSLFSNLFVVVLYGADDTKSGHKP